jgi:hypothetical protein
VRTAPTAESDKHYLLCVNGAWLPILLGKLAELERGAEWETDDDHQRGYRWICEVHSTVACINELTERLDRIIVLMGGTQALADPLAPPTPMAVGDNILLALRGTTDASALRNVIDALSEVSIDDEELLEKLVQIIALLG